MKKTQKILWIDKVTKKLISGVFILYALCTVLEAKTSMWKVEGNDGYVTYLGGTCHVLRKSDYPLPVEYDQAYARVEHVILEADLERAKDPAMQNMLLTKGMYMDGTTIDKILNEEAYQALEAYCQSAKIPMATFSVMKIPLILLAISDIEMQKLGIKESGVDMYFQNQAKKDGKKLEGLETIEEQMDFLINIGKGNESEMVLATLQDLNETSSVMGDLLKAWRAGDDKKLEELISNKMKKRFPKVYETLLISRNKNWQPRIEELIKTPEPELVLVGAAHLVGQDGILHQLEKNGFKVSRFEATP